MFATVCHGTWNYLSEVSILGPYLYAWRDDNLWLHAIGGYTIAVCTVVHVWSLLLPSIFSGYENQVVPGRLTFPAQVQLSWMTRVVF